MPLVTTSKSRTLSGITDLTLLAPVKRGLIEALDTRSHASRARLVMRTLNTLRLSSREVDPTPLVADLVDRVQAIHSFRVALIDQNQEPRHLLLNVVFDGGWEPYMRRIWRDLGPLLDLIFCNSDGYPLSADSQFAEYAAWVRRVQVETDFFYTAAPVTVGDLHYLRNRGHTVAPTRPLDDLLAQAMPALVALYRLSDMHPPHSADGRCLLRAARHLLGRLSGGLLDDGVEAEVNRLMAANDASRSASERMAVKWFYMYTERDKKEEEKRAWTPSHVQGGIVEGYPQLTHGCLVLVSLRDAAAAQALLEYLLDGGRLLSAADRRNPWGGKRAPYHNVSFTLQGLQQLGVPDGSLGALPAEFREGMAARAGILGDVDINHPTRWRLPRTNWGSVGEPANGLPIELAAVHAVVQIQLADTASKDAADILREHHPLHPTIKAFEEKLADKGVRILAVQALQRSPDAEDNSRDAFGFLDGISQPKLDVPKEHRDYVEPGDLLLGYRNSLGDEPALKGRLWDDGSFLVLRKLRQDTTAFTQAVGDDDQKKKALMGRKPDGSLRLRGADADITGNDFDFSADKKGLTCPFASHIRRANPREDRKPDMPHIPRILRRGMSWRDANGDCGLVFMAYSASIAEQFEVIQGWLAGGNSSGQGLHSGQRDPLLGVPLAGDLRVFEYYDDQDNPQQIKLPKDRPFATLDWGLYLFVPSLPALAELRELAGEAARLEAARLQPKDDATAADEGKRRRREERSLIAQRGAGVIAQLRRAEQALSLEAARDQWKMALEDLGARMAGTSEAIWAAIAEVHGGALRTPFGVLVAGATLVQQVLSDTDRHYTASGYNHRLAKSFGPIYLGLDHRASGSKYEQRSTRVNEAIQSIDEADAFVAAYGETCTLVNARIAGVAEDDPLPRVEVRDMVDAVLAALCKTWFGVPDGKYVHAGGWHWSEDATCPGHFGAPSRYTFQPNPRPHSVEVGKAHGQKLLAQVTALLKTAPPADEHRPILRAIRQATAALAEQATPGLDEEASIAEQARTLIGVMMGFLPTVDGSLRGVLWEWVEDRSLWTLQIDLLAALPKLPRGDAAQIHPHAQTVLGEVLARTLHRRPVPEMVWRTALVAHTIGGVPVQPGDLVVAGLVGALQQKLAEDKLDLSFLFGGYRPGCTAGARDALTQWMKPSETSRSAPTHACPGHRIAWGVMLGFLAGLLCSARLQPTLSSMSLRLGPLP